MFVSPKVGIGLEERSRPIGILGGYEGKIFFFTNTYIWVNQPEVMVG